jgi:hypothetical protein
MKEVQKLLKLVSDGLKSLAQGVDAIAKKVDETAKTKRNVATHSKKQSESPKSDKRENKAVKEAEKPAPQAAKKKAAKPATAMDTVLNIIGSSKTGITTAAIREKSGYEQKKVSNIVYKLKKQGKIKALKKGVYVKA